MKNMMKLEIGNSACPARVILFPYICSSQLRSMVMFVFFLSPSHWPLLLLLPYLKSQAAYFGGHI